jgi:hypothetical protein
MKEKASSYARIKSGNEKIIILKKWRKRAYIFVMFGAIQAFFLMTISMFFYTGGTPNNSISPGYSFWVNPLSDLGKTVAYSGLPNTISSVIFNISLFFLGASLIPYFLAMPGFFKGLKEASWFSIIGSIIGILLGLTLIGCSLFPSDLFGDIHIMFGTSSFLITVPMVIFYVNAIFLKKNFPNRYSFIFMVLGIVFLILFIFMILSNPDDTFAVFSIGEKMIIYGIILCFFFQGYGSWKLQKTASRIEIL